jgi:transcription initiation factor TFIIB
MDGKDSEGNVGELRGRSEVDRERLQQLSERQRRKKLSRSIGKQRLHAQDEIERLTSLLSIHEKTREGSLEIYREAWENDLIHGRSIEKILAASIYMACRKNKEPRTLDEIENATNVGRKDIIKTCKLLAKRLDLRLTPTSPLEYVSSFCDKLNLEQSVEDRARKIIYAALARDITSGRGPTGIAASAIYIAAILCNNRKTQKDVAEATGVTEVTLRVRYKELARELDIKVE